MMQLRFLIILILLVTIDARRESRFASRWRNKKGLRGGGKTTANKPETNTEPEATKPEKPAVDEASVVKPAKPAEPEVVKPEGPKMLKPADTADAKPADTEDTKPSTPKVASVVPVKASEPKMTIEKQPKSDLPTKIEPPKLPSIKPAPGNVIKEPQVTGAGAPPNMGMYHAMGPPGMGPPPGMGGKDKDSTPVSVVGASA